MGVGCKHIAAGNEGLAEVVPESDSGEIEKRLRDTVCRNLGQSSENEHVHQGCQNRLNDVPERPEDGLFVIGDNVTSDVHDKEVPVVPKAFEVEFQQSFFRSDDMFVVGFDHLRTLIFFKVRKKDCQ